VHRVPKNVQSCFCQNFIKCPPTLIFSNTKTVKTIKAPLADQIIFHLTILKADVSRRSAEGIWKSRVENKEEKRDVSSKT